MADRCVVVVNDEPAYTVRLSRMFRALGFEVGVAIDCRAAMRQIEGRRPDVVCVSLRLPRESGYDLCELVRKDRRFDRVPLLVVSDRHSPDIMAHAEEAGANAFLRRPFDQGMLAECLNALWRRSPAPARDALSYNLDGDLATE